MSTSRRTLLTVVPFLLLALLWSAPAHGADEIGFSNDGVSWSSALPEPLFDPTVRWVPGDERSASFHVRNQGPSTALMMIEVRGADPDDLIENDDIHLRARPVGGSWVPLQNGVASAPLTEDRIRVGESVQIQVSATFEPASLNQSQIKNLPLTFTVTLAEADAGAEPPTADGPAADDAAAPPVDRRGVLPGTGAVISVEILLAAIAFCALGAFLIVRRSSADAPQNGVTS